MADLTQLIERLARKLGGYTAAADRLGITYQALIKVRKRGGALEDDRALIIAEELEIPEIEAIAATNIRRTKSPEMRAKWERLAGKLLWACGLVIAAYFAPEQSGGEFLLIGFTSLKGYTLCVLLGWVSLGPPPGAAP